MHTMLSPAALGSAPSTGTTLGEAKASGARPPPSGDDAADIFGDRAGRAGLRGLMRRNAPTLAEVIAKALTPT